MVTRSDSIGVKQLCIAHLNVRSLGGHFTELKEHMLTAEYNVVVLSETFVKSRF